MKKSTAHGILFFFDIASILACFYAIREFNEIIDLIAVNAERITFQSYFSFYFLTIFVPIIHGTSLINWNESTKKALNIFLVAVFLITVTGLYSLNLWLETKLTDSNYTYCTFQSNKMTFSEFKTYLKAGIECK